MSEELIGQEQAGVSSHKGDWVEGEVTEQKNIAVSPGAVSLATRSILETCSRALCSRARYREPRHLQVISEVRLFTVLFHIWAVFWRQFGLSAKPLVGWIPSGLVCPLFWDALALSEICLLHFIPVLYLHIGSLSSVDLLLF